MDSQNKKVSAINLVVDSEMYDALIRMSVLMAGDVGNRLEVYRTKDKYIYDAWQRMIQSLIEPIHEAGWCKDPNCEWEPKEKINEKK